jgi:hypothetical protein
VRADLVEDGRDGRGRDREHDDVDALDRVDVGRGGSAADIRATLAAGSACLALRTISWPAATQARASVLPTFPTPMIAISMSDPLQWSPRWPPSAFPRLGYHRDGAAARFRGGTDRR